MNILKTYSAIKNATEYNDQKALNEATKLIKDLAQKCYENSLDIKVYRLYEAITDICEALKYL